MEQEAREILKASISPMPFGGILNLLAAWTSRFTQAELLYGVESLPPGKRRTRLLASIEKILNEEFEDRILPFDEAAARRFAKIAAIARSRDAAVATRNTADFGITRNYRYRCLEGLIQRGSSIASLLSLKFEV